MTNTTLTKPEQDATMKVYYAPQSRAVRTVWLLEEIGMDYELEKFTLGQKEMRGPEYTSVNPNGRVPTLMDGDVTLTESTAIAQYLESLCGSRSCFFHKVCAPVKG